ncbi:uncharacterized protein HD556DRAFT_1233126 [Suillus plorans]|uniref:Uncharacterized protein n=1 Tax=Suillus plorans TaxID=116603 RepID=A0A9P7IZQ1_9AGAM|nr:uncharacterized protein HD556DRAFT_1233126 [Suillus plorans]KAG1797700.1 hypothetical protein HD556DRAFT_1233126 [Suillus plorans]
MDYQLSQKLNNVLQCLEVNRMTISDFIKQLLQSTDKIHHSAKKNLVQQGSEICTHLYQYPDTRTSISLWAYEVVREVLGAEIKDLVRKENGLHFRAKSATTEQLEHSFMPRVAEKIRRHAPTIWRLIYSLLEASDERRSTGKAMVDEMVMTEVFADAERDLGEIGGDNGVDESTSDTSDEQRNDSREHRTHVQVEARNTTLQIIKTVVCISIILQSSNERCNYLQGLLGIFFHSTGVPQKVIDVLAHAGLSISVTSIHNAVHSMSKEIAANIKQGIRSLKVSFAYDLTSSPLSVRFPTLGTCAILVDLCFFREPPPPSSTCFRFAVRALALSLAFSF